MAIGVVQVSSKMIGVGNPLDVVYIYLVIQVASLNTYFHYF